MTGCQGVCALWNWMYKTPSLQQSCRAYTVHLKSYVYIDIGSYAVTSGVAQLLPN